MAKLDFDINLTAEKDKVMKLITDYENLPSYLPAYIKSVKIIEQKGDETTTEVIIAIPTIIKNKIEQKSIIKKLSENSICANIISGPAKGTVVNMNFDKTENGIKIIFSINLKLSLKARFLQPIIKKWCKSIITGILYKINTKALEL